LNTSVFVVNLLFMRKLTVILFILMLFLLYCMPLLGEERYYILTSGFPYSEPIFNSKKYYSKKLFFGDKVLIENNIFHHKIPWYLCSNGSHTFYLPQIELYRKSLGVRYDKDGNLPLGEELVDIFHSIPLSYVPSDLVEVPQHLKAEGYENREMLLRKEALSAFSNMIHDAMREGIHIRIISAFRDSYYQAYLYTRAIRQRGENQNSVAKPGHSEHQLGTTCDLTTNEIHNALSIDFINTSAFQWLKQNSYRYGIYLTYTEHKSDITGYIHEPWHYRYWGKQRWKFYSMPYNLFLTR